MVGDVPIDSRRCKIYMTMIRVICTSTRWIRMTRNCLTEETRALRADKKKKERDI